MSMSEAEFEDIVRKRVEAALLKQSKENKPSVAPVASETHADHILHCPECFEATVKKLKESPYVCNDCENPLGDEELVKKLPACPFCGGTHPRKR